MGELDPTRLLKALPKAIAEAQQTSLALRRGDAAAAYFPTAEHRWLTSRETLEAVRERKGDPAVPALSGWLFALILLRVNLGVFREGSALWAKRAIRVRHPEAVELTVPEAMARLVADTRRVREDTLVGLAAEGSRLGDPIVEAAGRAQEIAKRAGLAHLDDVYSPLPAAERTVLATELTLATNDLARDVLGSGDSLGGVLARLGAEGLAVPLPKVLGPRWVVELFPKEAGIFELPGLSLGALPKGISATSYARLLARLGARYADAATACEVLPPFGATPAELRRRTFGVLFASLLLSPIFLQRRLGFSAREASAATRAYALSFFGHVRLAAAKVSAREALLSGNGQLARQAAADHAAQALYTEIPRGLALVLPRPRLTDPGSFLALSAGATLANELREEFDEDWFRNPKAFGKLRDLLARQEPLTADVEAGRRGQRLLITGLVERLG
jgi:hypothetical protein